MIYSDLHIHTNCSDGQYSPAKVVSLAKKHGLTNIAITDHDTVSGIEAALLAGREQSVNVIPGVELSAKEYKKLHILGYNFHTDAPELTDMCNELVDGRTQRKYRIVDFLRERGVNVSVEEVEAEAGGNVIGRPHFAAVMVKKGYVGSVQEAFDKHLDTPEFVKIEREKASAEKCISVIKKSGGKTSLAHPHQLQLNDDRLEGLINKLKDFGLDAIECFYPLHTDKQTAFYLELAKKYDLHVTGGSDFHGEKVKPDITFSKLKLDINWIYK